MFTRTLDSGRVPERPIANTLDMTVTHTFAAQILSTSAVGLARLAAEKTVPQLVGPSRYGDDASDMWREQLSGRLSDLSLALADDRPEHFSDQLGWAKIAFGSRGVPESDLKTSLLCLREVLAAELPEEVGAVSISYLDAALSRWESLGVDEPSALHAQDEQGKLAARYVVALLEGDRTRACELVLGAVRSGDITPRDALLHVCLPAEKELGRMWHLDEITIAEEHFITATTLRLMGQVVALAPHAEPNGKTVIAASLSGDDHDLGLRAVTDLMEMDGWRVVFLGSNLPVEDLVWSVTAFRGDLVLMSATLLAHAHQVASATLRLKEAGDVPVLVGGGAFVSREGLWQRVGADAVALSADDALPAARRLVGLGG
jgi:methanogenic corrinoid protein MtbC1